MKCKFIEKSLVFMLLFMLYSPLKAQEWLTNIKNPRMPYTFQYSSQTLKESDAETYSDKIEMEKVSGKVILPISISMDQKHSLSADFNQTQIDQINKNTTSPIPEKLTEEKYGYQFINHKDDRRYYGANFMVGSASDKPFHNWSVTEVSLTTFYYYEQTPMSSWTFLINYSNQRSFLPHVPLPGVTYMYNNQEGFTLIAGIPVFGFVWRFADDWMFNYFSLIPWSHQAKLTYFVSRPFQIYLEYKIAPETFKLVDYTDNEDRVIMEDQKAILGTVVPIAKVLSLDIHGGYSFGRKIYQAKRPGSSEDWLEEIEDQAFFNAQMGIRF